MWVRFQIRRHRTPTEKFEDSPNLRGRQDLTSILIFRMLTNIVSMLINIVCKPLASSRAPAPLGAN
jgi:hypothetical protein